MKFKRTELRVLINFEPKNVMPRKSDEERNCPKLANAYLDYELSWSIVWSNFELASNEPNDIITFWIRVRIPKLCYRYYVKAITQPMTINIFYDSFNFCTATPANKLMATWKLMNQALIPNRVMGSRIWFTIINENSKIASTRNRLSLHF